VHNFVAVRAQSATDVRRPSLWIGELMQCGASAGGGCGILQQLFDKK
jgi:hypothetical protein